MSIRPHLILYSIILCALCLASLPSALPHARAAADYDDEESGQTTELPGFSMDNLRDLADSITKTGKGKDSIPALSRSGFVTVSDASLSMDDEEVVFIVHYPDGRVRIYPQRILVWHEVINDVLPDASGNLPPASVPGMQQTGGQTYSITYSPLTGTVVAFRSMASDYPSSFGVTGDLLNGNTVLYDRVSHSLWSQLLAACVEGPFRGKRLERVPVLWGVWRGVKERYSGKAEVLSRSTGFKLSYGKDPYGSYQRPGTYYDNMRLIAPISYLDSRLPPKKRVLGLELEDLYGALDVEAVKEKRVVNFTMGITPFVAFHDAQLDAVRVFDRRLPGHPEPLNFIIFEDKFVDEQTKSEWSAEGVCSYGRFGEKKLTPMLTIDTMWFAWAAFHRGTSLYPDTSH